VASLSNLRLENHNGIAPIARLHTGHMGAMSMDYLNEVLAGLDDFLARV
jgi:hypothetical protein